MAFNDDFFKKVEKKTKVDKNTILEHIQNILKKDDVIDIIWQII